jgi:hypothetical protein
LKKYDNIIELIETHKRIIYYGNYDWIEKLIILIR